MNASYKCNTCCKEDVCKYKDIYASEVESVMKFISGSDVLEVSIRCKKHMPHPIELGGVKHD